ncbi:GNAT family N-acetyltransferase [Nocardioides sp.]|uniref:GNAT family N-acetyltransferase n=1 Tax=Nocardioides sp. TaxID=35761 RepID=UPI002D801E8E|nr:GNAT family N-acetyltransferase [Nocardioides sp.]HET8959892.1 GNAT family N-acetyltransferase [Nocardioides sp.]
MTALDRVRDRFLEVNGDHPMSPEDDCYVRAHFVEVPGADTTIDAMAAGRLPLPSYLLSDGTPMVPRDHLAPVEWAGGLDRLGAWFLDHWPGDQQAAAREEWAAYLAGQYVCLRSVTPLNIRRKTALVAQVRAAVEVLERDPHDTTARGSLGEATSRLEDLELPMTGYDRLRFGGALSRETWIDEPRRLFLDPVEPQLPVRTERLVLRHPVPEDAEALFAYYSDPEVARYLPTPPLDRRQSEAEIRRRISRHAGEGRAPVLSLVIELDGRMVGELILMLQGPSYSQAEVGWVLDPAVAGRGVATEAARALIDLAFAHYRFHRITAQLDARNHRSAALCERLGMRLEARRRRDYWSKGEWTDSLEYAVLADEWSSPPAELP